MENNTETKPIETATVEPEIAVQSPPASTHPAEFIEPETALAPEPDREVAYIINDRYFKGFEVKKSANAWWMDRQKVEELIKCFKQGMGVELSASYIGISLGQYKYFVSIHPEFSTVKERCQNNLKIIVKKGIYNKLVSEKDEMLRWAAERLMPEEYGKPDQLDGRTINNNFGTVINAPVDITKLKPSVLKDVMEFKQSMEAPQDNPPTDAQVS